MKPRNRILLVVLSLIAVFTANHASAFYNPQTGRWLSRDPVGEPGFQLLQAANALPRVGRAAPLPSGRFINRDPFGEKGGRNLYGFVANNLLNRVDFLGLTAESPGPAGHCQDPCKWAREHAAEDEPTVYGVTVCCNGKKYGCVLKPGNGATDPTAKSIIT